MLARLALGAASAFVLALGAFGLLARGGGPTSAAQAPVAAPHGGFDSQLKRTEPTHDPTPAQP